MSVPVQLKSLRLLAIVLLSFNLGYSQQIPVTCSSSHDVAKPPHPPAPHDAAPVTTEAQAIQIDQAGRQQPGFISMPELENFGILRYRISEYADCKDSKHCYWSDLEQQTTRARNELKRLLAQHKGETNLAIILDIDETSLSSYCELKREGFGYIATQYNQWLVSPEASIAIPGTLRLFNHARSLGIDVFFITGRTGANGVSPNGNPVTDQTAATARNLTAAGYKRRTRLILRNEQERTMDTTWYKSSERAIIAQKYRIILSMGDQWSDLNGDPKAEISVKLPNPFYYLP